MQQRRVDPPNPSLPGLRVLVRVHVFGHVGVRRAGRDRAVGEHEHRLVDRPEPQNLRANRRGHATCVLSKSGHLFAVGGAEFASTGRMLIEHWNGHRWAIMTNPSLAGASRPFLGGISCPSTTSCFAGGSADFGAAQKQRTLIIHWNGSRWSTMSNPDPAGSTSAVFEAVSCHSAVSCYAVGTYWAGSSSKTLIEHWNGHGGWSIMNTPDPVGATGTFLGERYTCPGTTTCVAVGSYYEAGSTSRTLAQLWNGSDWTITSSADVAGSVNTSLSSVSCLSITSCFAVGTYFKSGISRTLVERWDGTRWSIVSSPNPAGAGRADLDGVSCHGLTSCFAVGNWGAPLVAGKPTKTLIEHWNGTRWSIMPPDSCP